VDPEETWTPEDKRDRKFRAHQGWNVKLPVSQAETVLQAAINAGANESTEPDWDVADRSSLQAKAGAAALAKAKKIADEMATGLGVKLGKLVYASNKAPAALDFLEFPWYRGALNTTASTVSKIIVQAPLLKLFPQKVKQDATVFAVFSIE
jgi:hypothetical protein